MTRPSSEVCPFSLEAIAYLDRNDLSDICQLDGWVLSAKDGARLVYIWLGGNMIPLSLIRRAAYVKARLDIISVDDRGRMLWQPNVGP